MLFFEFHLLEFSILGTRKFIETHFQSKSVLGRFFIKIIFKWRMKNNLTVRKTIFVYIPLEQTTHFLPIEEYILFLVKRKCILHKHKFPLLK